jgi:hypothetical protein
MGITDERTSCIDNLVSSRAPFCPFGIGSAVGCDYDASRMRLRLVEGSFNRAVGAKLFAHDGVVNEFAENGQGRLGGELFSLGNGIANAETGPEMLGDQYFHSELCVTKFIAKFFFISFPLSQSVPARLNNP